MEIKDVFPDPRLDRKEFETADGVDMPAAKMAPMRASDVHLSPYLVAKMVDLIDAVRREPGLGKVFNLKLNTSGGNGLCVDKYGDQYYARLNGHGSEGRRIVIANSFGEFPEEHTREEALKCFNDRVIKELQGVNLREFYRDICAEVVKHIQLSPTTFSFKESFPVRIRSIRNKDFGNLESMLDQNRFVTEVLGENFMENLRETYGLKSMQISLKNLDTGRGHFYVEFVCEKNE